MLSPFYHTMFRYIVSERKEIPTTENRDRLKVVSLETIPRLSNPKHIYFVKKVGENKYTIQKAFDDIHNREGESIDTATEEGEAFGLAHKHALKDARKFADSVGFGNSFIEDRIDGTIKYAKKSLETVPA